jgi:hypothetical protein
MSSSFRFPLNKFRKRELRRPDVCFGSLADGEARIREVRFTPKSGRALPQHGCPLSAMCGRLPIGKGFFENDARLVGAAMCPAC